MAETVSDFLIARLAAWGVTRIYGYPGDRINGISVQRRGNVVERRGGRGGRGVPDGQSDRHDRRHTIVLSPAVS